MRRNAIADLHSAYLNANYEVWSDPPFTLRIGEANADLIRLYGRLNCEHCVYLSACNPRSRVLRPAANARRMRTLAAILSHQGWNPIAGEGRDPAGDWPGESSLLVPGMRTHEALSLARRFGQNAFVATDPQGVPELVWVPRPEPPPVA